MTRWLSNDNILQLYKAIKFWQLKISSLKHKKVFNKALANIKRPLIAEYHDHIQIYLDTPVLGLSKIRKELKKQKDIKLQELRNQESTESSMIAQAEHTSSDQIERRREQVRYTKTIYSSLRNRFRPPHTKGITSVIIPTTGQHQDKPEEVIIEVSVVC